MNYITKNNDISHESGGISIPKRSITAIAIALIIMLGITVLSLVGCPDNTGADTTPPAQVTGLTQMRSVDDTSVTLSWTNPADTNLETIRITVTPSISGFPLDVPASGASMSQSEVVTGLVATTDYTFTILTIDAAENVSSSSTAPTVTAATTSPTLSNFAATPTNLEVALSWDVEDRGSDITAYTLTRAFGSTAAVTITVPDPSVTMLTDTVPAAGVYTYSLTATNAEGNSDAVTVTATVTVAPTLSNFAATPTGLDVALSWDVEDRGSDITGYTLTRKLGSDAAVTITVADPTDTMLTDTVPAAGDYTYSLTATNAGGSDDATVTATAIDPLGTPAKVTGLSVAVESGGDRLSWDRTPGTVTDYEITARRETETGFFLVVNLLTADHPGFTYFQSLSASPRPVYIYRIRAINDLLEGAYSEVVSSANPVPTLTNFAAAVTGPDVTLTWDVNNGGSDITGYTLTRALGSDDAVTIASALATDALTFTDTVPLAGEYTYSLIATNGIGSGPVVTETATVIIPPPQVTGLTVAVESGGNRLSWDRTPGTVTDYEITARRETETGFFLVVNLLTADHPGFTYFQSLTASPRPVYIYRIRAINDLLDGAYSELVSTAPKRR